MTDQAAFAQELEQLGARPAVGAVMESTRTKSGRRWKIVSGQEHRVRHLGRNGSYSYVKKMVWWLQPLGDDVQPAMHPKTHRWQGGVRSIERTDEQLRSSAWRMVEAPPF